MNLKNVIQSCKNGERLGQKALYDAFASQFFRLSFRYVRLRADAEDCVLEAFMLIFENLQRFDYQSDSQTEAWLKRIVVNQSLKCLRKRNAFFTSDFEENGVAEIDDGNFVDDELSAKQILDLITELPDGYRTVFNLYVVEGFAHIEIAKMLNISENTSKSQLFKAKRALRKLLNKEIL